MTGRSLRCSSPSLWRPPRVSVGEARSSTVPAPRFARKTRTSSRRFSHPMRDRPSVWRQRLRPLGLPRPTMPHASSRAVPRRRTDPFAFGRRSEAATRTSVPASYVRRCRERAMQPRSDSKPRFAGPGTSRPAAWRGGLLERICPVGAFSIVPRSLAGGCSTLPGLSPSWSPFWPLSGSPSWPP